MVIVNMRIRRAIAHEVLRQTKATTELTERPPISSNSLMPIDEQVASLIRDRLTESLGSNSHCVEVSVDVEGSGSTFQQVACALDAEDDDFISISQSLAQKLANTQIAGSIKSGIALFIQGSCIANDDPVRFITIIKADSDKALSKRVEDDAIMFEYINDLLFSSSQRLIKIAFFIEKPDCRQVITTEGKLPAHTPDDFSIKVYDHLMQNSSDKSAAAYFYKAFLGCKIAATAAVKTKGFYNVTIGFINNSDFPQEKKVELKNSTISYFRSNVETVAPTTFAREVLPQEYQEPFIKECKEKGVEEPFSKDNDLIRSSLRRQSIKFTSDVTIVAKPDVLNESVRIGKQNEDGWTDIRIRGYITL